MMKQSIWQALQKVALAETDNLKDLATLLNEDPAVFYIGTDLTGVDLRGQDLRSVGLYRTNIEKSIFDGRTVFDADLSAYLGQSKQKKYLEISSSLMFFCKNFYSPTKFPSNGWFLKTIIPPAAALIREDPSGWIEVINRSPDFRAFFNAKDRKRIELTLTSEIYESGKLVGSHFGGRAPSLTALTVVALLNLISYRPHRDKLPVQKDNLLHEYLLFPQFHSHYI